MTTTLLVGHVLDVLKTLEDESVHCVITSPPYWGLRAYGTIPQVWGGRPDCDHVWKPIGKRGGPAQKQGATSQRAGRSNVDEQITRHISLGVKCERCLAWRGEHGQEPTFDLWLQHEVLIFREVKRVLRKDGSLYLNIGDAYSTTPNGRSAEDQNAAGTDNRTFRNKLNSTIGGIFKPKDRLMMPARLAIALHADGWWVRDEIIWNKKNPMPSSIKDRTCPAHEMVYHLTKAPRYFYDYVAIQEDFADDRMGRDYKEPDAWDTSTGDGGHGAFHKGGRGKGRKVSERNRGGREDGFTKPNDIDPSANGGRLKRSVWSLPLEPFPEAHFATFPTELIRPMIEAGTSTRGVCPHCGAPWQRVTEKVFTPQPDAPKSGKRKAGQTAPETRWEGSEHGSVTCTTIGWQQSCKCKAHEPVPATVLDPFGGSGTTGLVADLLGRNAVLIELNPVYAQLARKRIRENLGKVKSEIPEDRPNDLPLFQQGD